MDDSKALENVLTWYLQKGLEKALIYLIKLLTIGRKNCFKLLKGIEQDLLLKLQIIRPCFTKERGAVVERTPRFV